MLDLTTNYVQRLLGSLTIISITIGLGTQANGQSTTVDLQKLKKKMEVSNAPVKAKRTPVQERRMPVKASPAATRSGKLKVPKFGVEATKKTPVQTFTAPTETIEYSDKVKSKAQFTLERYDRDKNGFLDDVELASGSWGAPGPLTYDKNEDGRLSLAELQKRYYDRYAQRQKYYSERSGGEMAGRGRQMFRSSGRGSSNDQTNGKQDTRSSDSDRARSSSSRDSSESKRASRSRTSRSSDSRTTSSGSRFAKETSNEFTKLDTNEDRLVQMHEFSDTWPKDKLEEFRIMDRNGDGVISPEEW